MGGKSMINYKGILQPVYGKMAWNVRKGMGSFLTFEVGEPRLQILREPVPSKGGSSPEQRKQSRRIVKPRGEWHLLISCCDWKYTWNGEEIGTDKSPEQEIVEIAKDLEGMKLESVRTDEKLQTHFQFEDNRTLTTIPNAQASPQGGKAEQWLFYTPKQKVLIYTTEGDLTYEEMDSGPVKVGLPM
jgi:hypothetical protein